MYSKSSVTWVTADSVSMVYEALSAGCRVGVIAVDWKKPNKIQKGVELLVSNNRILSHNRWEANHKWPSNGELNEAKRCAKEILNRWWPDRLKDHLQ